MVYTKTVFTAGTIIFRIIDKIYLTVYYPTNSIFIVYFIDVGKDFGHLGIK